MATKEKKQGDLKEVLNALDKVNLEPLLMPLLKMTDPIMGALPKGSVKKMLDKRGARNSITDVIEDMAPKLPGLVKFGGRLANFKPLTGMMSLCAVVVTPVMSVVAPPTVKLVEPMTGPAAAVAKPPMKVLAPVGRVVMKPFKR